MKKLTVRLFAVMAMALTTAMSVFGQNGFSYQAVIRNAEGKLITNKQVEVKFTLKHDGTDFYSEKQSVKTNEYGNIQVVVGNGEKLDGDFANVPWSSFDVKMEVAVDIDGKSIILGEVPVNGAPYAMYAQKAGGLTSKNANTKDGEALFAVNDANGNPVFAVFADGIVVYVDDTEAAKAKRSGFVVTGRSASKDNAATEYFSVTAEGTQIYVNDTSADKVKRSGFVVKSRTATKDGESDEYLTVGGEGTTVFVDDEDSSKVKRSGFVVKSRTASKDGDEPQYFETTTDGTTVYIDDDDSSKVKRSGFVVKSRTASKDGDADNYLAVGTEGTQVYVDGADAEKVKRSGFVVKSRTASKAEEDTLFAIEGGYTRIYIDDDEADKAKRSGFVVTGRSASKDSSETNYLDISKDSTNFLATEFNVVERVTETTSQEPDTTAVQPQPGDTTPEPAPVVQKPKSLFTINSGNVQIGTEMVMMGEVVKKIEADTISTDTVEAVFPTIAKIVDRADTVSCAAYKPFVYGNDSDSAGYAILGIYAKGIYAKVTATDARNNTVLLIDTNGNITKMQKTATVAVLMPEGDTQVYIRPLKATSQTISFGLMKKNATEPYQYIKVEAEIEASAGVPYKINTSSNYGGRVVIDGTLAYGDKPTFEAVPQVGYAFVRWSDGSTQSKHPITILNDFDISAEFERMSYVVAVKSDNELFGTVSGEGTYWHGDTAMIEATPFTGYYFNNWSGLELNDSLQNSPSLAIEVTSKLNLIANFGKTEYTITFDTDGGSAVEPMTLYYQDKVTEPAEPTKTGYRFLEWEPMLPTEMPAESLTLKAIWSVKQFFVRFDTDGGTPVKTIEANYNEAVTAPEAPTKEGHTFAGWSDTIPATMPANDVKIKALWTVNQYTAAFVKVAGDTTKVTINFGDSLKASADTLREGYTFAGWNNTVPATMPARDTTFTALWTIHSHYIIYMVDSATYKTDSADYGTEIKAIEEPTKLGHTFSGWQNVPTTMPDSTITISGKFTANTHYIKYMVDSIAYKTDTVDYGTEIKTIEEPTKQGYTFSGWQNVPQTMPDSTITISGTFAANTNTQYTANLFFQNVDNDGYGEQPLKSFTLKDTTDALTKYTAPDSLGFTLQEFEQVAISGDGETKLNIYYNRNSYTLTWNADGGTLSGDYTSGQTRFDTAIVAPTATREGYTFAGWVDSDNKAVDFSDGKVTMPAKDTTFKATWAAADVKYTVEHWQEGLDGNYVRIDSVTETGKTGKTGSLTEAVAMSFAGFEAPETIEQKAIAANGSTVVTIRYARNPYTLSWKDGDETVGTDNLKYQAAVTMHSSLTRDGYTFKGWSDSLTTMPAANKTITAKWDTIKYTITYVLAEGSLAEGVTNPAKYTVVSADIKLNNPTRTGYNFAGWTGTDLTEATTAVTIASGSTGDRAYTATWAAISYTITATANPAEGGTVTGGGSYDYNGTAPLKATPATGYDFTGWDDGVKDIERTISIKGAASYVANFSKKTFSVTASAADATMGSVTVTGTDADNKCEYGSTVTLSATANEGYHFANWNGKDELNEATISFSATKDSTLTANFAINTYTITFKNGDEVLQSTQVEYGQMPEYNGENPTKPATAQYTYQFIGWDKEFAEVTGEATYTAQFRSYADLGLTSGTLWATTNVGASSPADYGDYFAWGETEPYYTAQNQLTWKNGKDNGYNWASYTKLSNGSNKSLTKYCNNSSYGNNGFNDGLTTLEAADDAATANWGSGRTTPTSDEFQELYDECYWEWTTNYNGTGKAGYIVYKSVDKSQDKQKNNGSGYSYSTATDTHIFLPAAGWRDIASLGGAGSSGSYWSSSLDASRPDRARYCNFGSSSVNTDCSNRYFGQSVRPVKKPKEISYYINSGMGDYTGHTGLTAELALPNINSALAKMNDNTANYTIIVNGKLTGNQVFGDTLNTRARSITICGLTGNTADSLYGNNSGTVLTINTTVPVTIKNLKISGGNATKGGGIYCYAGSNVTLDNGAKVAGNSAQEKGGGAYVDGAVVSGDTIRGKLTINELAEISNNKVVVTHSSGDDGGAGVYVNYGMMLLNGGEISNNYHGNSYNSTTVNGRGGIRLQCAIFTIRDGKISGNKSGHMGGNIFAVASRIDMLGGEISDGVIGYNTSSYDAVGGAFLLDINSVLNMSGGKITGNQTLAGQSKNGLGAVVVTSASIFNMSGGTISGNTIVSGNRMGSAVSVVGNGVLNISDSAYIASDNDVYLNSDRIINITAPLDSASVATITPQKYTTNQTILSGDAALIASQCTKFAVTPQINGTETIRWSISPDGKLLKADYVPVQGAYFDGSQRVDTSRVFIEGRQLAIQDLYACDHEVTQSEWYNVMGVTQEEIYSVNNFGRDNSNPVYYVGWYDAIAYCNKLSIREGLEPVYTVNGITDWTELQYSQIPTESNSDWNASTCDFNKNGYRLPTEAEWEYLARGGSNWDSFRYSGSNDSATVAWTIGSGSTHAVKTKQANTLGIYDMSGNVWEWVWDTTLTTGNNHIKCGGSWDYPAVYSSPTSRFYSPPLAGPYTGFRVVRTASNTDTCIITFNTNGGTAVAPMTVWRGYRLDVKPVNGTLNFGGWYTDSELTKPFEEGSVVTSDTTLYAKWLSDFIEVPGTYFDGTEAVANSAVFVKDTQILIRDLYACDHEVTQSEWYDVMNVPQEQLFAADSGRGPNYPVYNISWYDAIAYCNKLSLKNNLEPVYSVNGVTNWLGLDYADIPTTNNADWNAAVADYDKNGYRLPTEAEWEYLARGGSNWDSYRYSGSNSIDSVAWHNYNSAVNGKSLMHEVKTKRANSLGLYDMSGSTWEWCSDKRKDTVNVRGGSLKCNPLQYSRNDWCAVHRRGGNFPYTKTWELGFRVVRTARPLYSVVGGVRCPDMNSTLTAILNATDSVGVVLSGSVTATDLGKAENENSIIWAIKNTTAQKVGLVIVEGANIAVTDCQRMFYECAKLVSADLRGLNVSAVENMGSMFNNCTALKTINMSGFDTHSLTQMGAMFYNCNSLTTIDLSDFTTDNVTNFGQVFVNCKALTSLDLSSLNTGKAKSMFRMFYGCDNLTSLNLTGLQTSKVKNMSSMFYGCEKLTTLDLSSFQTDSLTTTDWMFGSCKALTSLDLSTFKTDSVTTMSGMFDYCLELTSLNVGSFSTTKLRNTFQMFCNCQKLTSLDLNGFDTKNDTNMVRMFCNCYALTSLDLSTFNISSVQKMDSMFRECRNLETIYTANETDWSATEASSVNMFLNCSKLVGGNGTNYSESNVTAIRACIDGLNGKQGYFTEPYAVVGGKACANKDSVIAAIGRATDTVDIVLTSHVTADDLGKAETEGTIINAIKTSPQPVRLVVPEGANIVLNADCGKMFQGCAKLVSADLRGLNTEDVTDMSDMFRSCGALTMLDLRGLNTAEVKNMTNMFNYCLALTTLDVSSFNTENVISMSGMFYHCAALTTLDVSGFNTANVTDMSNMFIICSELTSLDLSGFNTEKVKSMNYMFASCANLITIYAPSGADWNRSGLSSTNMFSGCLNLKGGNNTTYNSSNITAAYARIDKDGQPGYFTSNTVSYYVNPSMNGTTGLTADDALPTLGDAVGKIVNAGNPILNYTINISGTVTSNQELTSSLNGKAKSITLCGADNTTDILDGNNSGTVLTISTSVPVAIRNLKITGGNAENGGGINIASGASVTLADGALVCGNRTADGENHEGGGVYNAGTLFMYGSAMVGSNTATTAPVSGTACSNAADHGGGLYNALGAKAYLGYISENTLAQLTGGFYDNYAWGEAGGIYNKGTLKMSSGNISYNGSEGYSAGVTNNDSEAEFELIGGTISHNATNPNKSEMNSGGVRACEGNFIMRGGEISYNSSNRSGGVHVHAGTTTLIGGVIKNNTATTGQGIYFESGTLKMGGSIVVEASNDVYLKGGNVIGICEAFDTATCVATITPSSYSTSNQVLYEAGDITLSDWCGRFAVTPDNGTRWAIRGAGYLTQDIMDESSLQSAINSINASGISTTIELSCSINLTRGFSGKDASHKITIDGGDGYHLEIQNDKTDIIFKNVNFQNGYASNCGGMLKLVGKDLSDDGPMEPADNLPSLTIENCSFTNCETSGTWGDDGGSIYVKGYGKMALKNTTFQGSGNYQIAMSGGFIAAFLHKTQGLELTIEGCSFNGGTAGYGGAINLHAPTDALITFDNCVFKNNRVNPGGTAGAIDYYTSATLNISNTTFTNNEGAQDVNGTIADNALLRDGSQAILTNCTIDGEVVNGTKTEVF